MAKLKPIQTFHREVKEGDIVRIVSQCQIRSMGIPAGKEAVGYVNNRPDLSSEGTHYFSLSMTPRGHIIIFMYKDKSNPQRLIGYEVLRKANKEKARS